MYNFLGCGIKGHSKTTLHLLSLSPASSSAALQPSPPPPASISPAPAALCAAASVFLQPAADPSPASFLPPDGTVPSLLWCFMQDKITKSLFMLYYVILWYTEIHNTVPHNNNRKWWQEKYAVTLLSFLGASCAVGSLSPASSPHSCTDGAASGNDTDAGQIETRHATAWKRTGLTKVRACYLFFLVFFRVSQRPKDPWRAHARLKPGIRH